MLRLVSDRARHGGSSFFRVSASARQSRASGIFFLCLTREGGTNRGEEVPETPPIFSFLNRLAIQLSRHRH